MRKIIAYSGGYDSTYALASLVSEASDSDTIIAVSLIHHATGDAKLLRERNSKIIIIDKLRKKYPNIHLESFEIDISIPWDVGSASYNKGLSQPIFWICNIIPLIKDGDEIYLGYIRDDQAMLHIKDICNMFNSALRIQDNKKVTLKFPNKYYSKTEILSALMHNYPELLDYCSSCESTYYEANKVCGNCEPCKHMKQALLNLAITESGEYRDKCLDMLSSLYNIRVSIADPEETKEVKGDYEEVAVDE